MERVPVDEKMVVFDSICREHGLSITPQRTAIYRELVSSSDHPSAMAVFKKIREYYPNISLDTVNRTLLTFQKIGLAKVVESSGSPKSFDPNTQPHHHFRCVRCGAITDFVHEEFDALKVPPALAKKFIILDKVVHLEGICDKCGPKK